MVPALLIVDDNADFRAAVRAALEADGVVVVGEAADADDAADAVARLRPRLVLIDVTLPGRDGIALAEELAIGPDPPLVVFTSSREAAVYGRRLHAAPARGFIPKRQLTGAALASLLA